MNTYKTVLEIVADGSATYEERRSQELIIRSKLNWFDALDDDGRGLTRLHSKVRGSIESGIDSVSQKKSALAINDIP